MRCPDCAAASAITRTNWSSKSNEGKIKYEVLFKRDQEMTKFIEDFAETEAKGLAQQKETQQMIVSLLGDEQGLGRQNNMPSCDQVSEMQNDLSFKSGS